jgi:hypothetical protein
MFRIAMLPAERGDCIWIEYGDQSRPNRVLIDGGPLVSFNHLRDRIEALPRDQRRFELLVVTHVDLDHIEGIIKLLQDTSILMAFDDVWFNGFKHLEDAALANDELGGMEGEYLTALIQRRQFKHNEAFGKGPVMIPDEQADSLPARTLQGGLRLTLLSPTAAALRELRAEWRNTVRGHGIAAGEINAALEKLARQPRFAPADSLGRDHCTDVDALAGKAFHSDTSRANGSSIALFAEFDGRSAVLTGDAHAPVVSESIRRMLRAGTVKVGENGKLATSALVLSHHGSKGNNSPELIKSLDCRRYLISTDGSRFHHPDGEAIAWVIKNGGRNPVLCFNYESDDNRRWKNRALQRSHKYDAVYPNAPGQSLVIDV